eukprot:TRINITY_DN42608_c0_g1_i1.p1 TRINITY_DN42608_c0_g1~~TRINITY_DN42608_c0_g1_i1.p1  ORF type:complete len:299 (+),score=77.36 TRINITY_DN42608_c0_g1_i1:89-985(+)
MPRTVSMHGISAFLWLLELSVLLSSKSLARDIPRRSPENGPLKFHKGTEEKLLRTVHAALRQRAVPAAARPEIVLQEADTFCWNEHWMMLVGDEKGAVLDEAVQRKVSSFERKRKPESSFSALEFGTYIGYSAVRIARFLPSGTKLYSCDPDMEMQRMAQEIIRFADLQSKVELMPVAAQDAVRQLQELKLAFDFVFIDHAKEDYLPTLRLLESSGMLKDGAVIVADNVDVFQMHDYLNYVRSSDQFSSQHVNSTLEYTHRNPDGTPQIADGLEISTFQPKAAPTLAVSPKGHKRQEL